MKKALFILLLFSSGITNAQGDPKLRSIQHQVWRITEVMYHDVINPPAASRFYAYSILAGYEIMTQLEDSLQRFQGIIRQWPSNQVTQPAVINKELASLYGILEAGRSLLPSGYLLEAYQDSLISQFRSTSTASATIDSSIAFAKRVTAQIVQFAKADGYFRLSTLSRYKPKPVNGYWKPTAPEYMPAVEPHWRTIRTFFMDSAQQFRPLAPIAFDESPGSPFMQLAKEVYDSTRLMNSSQRLIANFWDCNPFAVQFEGHMSIGLKKISPGGHWLSIAGIVTEQANMSFNQTLFVHAVLAMTLHDAFISCWEEKYHSERIRPETAINRYIDPKWKPLLQTPPFPEYSSGHSVISSASAEILTTLLGDRFAFNDSTETYIGLPERKFTSFHAAAAEARISRLYGGIHFRDAIERGGEQGIRLANYIIKKMALKKL